MRSILFHQMPHSVRLHLRHVSPAPSLTFRATLRSHWQVFSPILVTVDMTSPVAVNQTVTVTGSVVDNQLVGVEVMKFNWSLKVF